MKKLIYLEDAINEIERWIGYLDKDMISRIQIGLERLPSAQPDVPDTDVGDTISRQDAIDEIDEWIKAFLENGHKESAADACLIQDGIIQLPPAQTDYKTDHGFMWLCPKCGLPVHSDFEKCVRCGYER